MKEKYLYFFTSFLCGLCVMGVEMSATRLLSPYFGSTNLIWTVIICLIMVGLGVGNYFGGLLADKRPRASVLYGYIAAGSVFIALIPFISRPVIFFGLQIVSIVGPENGFLLAAIISCIILFVPPIIILGMMSPYLAKLCVSDLNYTGTTLGRLYALSTIGCIIGSVLPMFVLIPLIGTKLSFMVFAALLFLPCLMYWLGAKMQKSAVTGSVCLLLAAAGAFYSGKSIAPDESKYETESSYQYLRVKQHAHFRTLSSGLFTYVQSVRFDDPTALTDAYLDALAALPALVQGKDQADAPVSMLVIGYGGGVLSTLLDVQYEEVDSVFVEIDPAMVSVARTHFGADLNDNVIVDDGRRFLQATDKSYDVIVTDAYQDTTIPVNLITREFFELCAQKLRAGGMFAMNNAMAGADTDFNRAIGETMKQVFPYVVSIPAPGGTNAILVGSEAPIPFEKALSQHDQNWALWPVIADMQKNSVDAPLGGEIMTDDRNNAEMLQLRAYFQTRYL